MWLFFGGFLSGLLFDICYLVTFLCNNNKIVKNIFECVTTLCSFVVLFLINLYTNYGQFRVYIFIVFFLSLLLQRVTLGKIIAKTKNACYNAFTKLVKRFTKTKNDTKEKI